MDLNAPLGMTPPPPKRGGRVVLAAAAIFAAAAMGGIVFIVARADPRGGEPYAVAALPPPNLPAPVKTLDTTPTGALPAAGAPAKTAAAPAATPVRTGSLEGGVMVYRGGGETGTAGAATAAVPLVIDVSRSLDDPLRKARGGTPSVTAPKPGASAAPVQPKVAIYVGGMGLDEGATRTAIETMPAAVTLAFVPYGGAVAASVGTAKSRGHEILLQLPMRNEGGAAPGPHALKAGEGAEAAAADLAWLMDRFAGYGGVTNLLGAPVTADPAIMGAVLKASAKRNVFYLDDGTSRRSVALASAADLHVPSAQADLVLDATSDPAVVRANLDRLVTIARRNGKAIGMASGLPEHLGTIARFAAELDGKGVALVPVGAVVKGTAADVASGSR